MISPRLQTSTFTPLNTSNVFTSTLNEDAQNTSFSSYHVTPRQGATPQQLSRIQENNEVDNSQITNTETYRDVIKELSTQLQMAILENRQLKDKLNVLEDEHNEGFQMINTQNQQLQESNFTLQEKINNLFSEIQQMQHQLEQKDQRLKEIREVNNNQDKMNHLIEENQKLIKIIETQQQEIKIQKDVIKQFEQALADSKIHESEMANKAKDYDQMKLDLDAYKQQQQQYQEQLMLWSQRYKSLDQNYQIQYQDLFQKFNLSQNQLSELHLAYENEREDNQRKIQYLMRELDQAKQGTYKKQQNNKVKVLEDQVEELQEQLQNKKNLIAQLKEELQEFQNVQKIARQRDSENCQERKNIDEQMSEKYEQRIRLLEEQLLKQGQQYQSQQVQQPQQQLPQQQLQQQQLPQQQMYERAYYNRTNESVKMQLFSEKKDNYRPYYSFAKENHPIENKFPRTTLTYGNNY